MVDNVKKGVRKKSPAPPFTTSTLQQEASRRLGFQARRTMKAAQELYEGVEVDEYGRGGPNHLYAYRLAAHLGRGTAGSGRSFIRKALRGQISAATKPRVYKSRSNAQDAHEAIRPTMPELAPDQVKDSLTADQYKLYKLIWERFIASQMATALLDTVSGGYQGRRVPV